MKKKLTWLFTLLTVALLIFGPAVSAAEILEVSVDKDQVQNGDRATVQTVFNNPPGSVLKNMTLRAELPEGLYAKEQEAVFEQVDSGERVTWELPISVGKDTPLLPGSTTGSNPKTGGSPTPGIALMILAAAVITAVFVGVKNRRQSAKMLSLLLAGVLGVQSLLPSTTRAAEEPITAEQTVAIMVNGKEEIIKIRAEIETAEPVADTEVQWRALNTSDTVATGARFFSVVINSKDAFADTITQEMLTTEGAFANTAIAGIEKLDNYTLRLSFETIGQREDTTAGIINFSEAAFQDHKNPGYAVVDVSEPMPYFEDGISAVNFQDDGNVNLAFCIDTAEFSDAVTAEDFHFNKPEVTAESITIPKTESRRDGIVTVGFNGVTDRAEQVALLRNLTMTIDEKALNSHSLNLTLTLAESPISAEAWINSIDTADDGSLLVTYDGQILPETGAVDLLNTSAMPRVTAPDLPDAVCVESLATGTDSFRIVASIAPQEGIEPSELAANWLYTQQLILPEGAVTDVYGQPVKEETYDIGVRKQMAKIALGADETSIAYDCTSQILSGVKDMASGDIVGGVLGIFGIGSVILDPTFEKLNAIKEDLNTLNQKTDAINQSIQNLSVQMQNTLNHMQDQEKRKSISAFGTAVDKLAWTVNKVNSADGGMIVKALEAGEDSAVYNEMAAKVCEITGSSEGGGDSFSRDTLALGKAILGDTTTETDSVFDLYSELIESRYNWMTEAQSDKITFMTYGLNVYLKAYMLSMCYMQSNNADHRYDTAITQLVNQMKQISDKEQAMMAASTPEAGQNILLLNHQTYPTTGFVYPITLYSWIARKGADRAIPEFDMVRMLRTWIMESLEDYCSPFMAEQTLNDMKARMAASGYTNLYDELKAAGFELPAGKVYIGGYSGSVKQRFDRGISGGISDYYIYMDYYDLTQNTAVKNAEVTQMTIEYRRGLPGRRQAQIIQNGRYHDIEIVAGKGERIF